MLIALGFFFGAFFGSFLNVCIHRLPRNESIVQPPSRCYACGTQVQWYDNLPILGYLILRGKCRWCDTPFSPRYLVMEVAVGLITAGVVALAFNGSLMDQGNWWWAQWPLGLVPRQGLPSFGIGPYQLADLLEATLATAALLSVAYLMVVAVMTDLDHMIIPDEITLGFQVVAPFAGACAGTNLLTWNALPYLLTASREHGWHVTPGPFIQLLLVGVLGGALLLAASLRLLRPIYSRITDAWQDQDYAQVRTAHWWFLGTLILPTAVACLLTLGKLGPVFGAVSLAQSVLGALVGWALPWLVGLGGTYFFGKSAMGFGDVKLLAGIGCFLGPVGVVYGFFAGTMIGAVLSVPIFFWNRKLRVPFGPYLATGCVTVLLFGNRIDHAIAAIFPAGN
jgi:leader peptidase (prepilin peptidase)/N-methyltransferase